MTPISVFLKAAFRPVLSNVLMIIIMWAVEEGTKKLIDILSQYFKTHVSLDKNPSFKRLFEITSRLANKDDFPSDLVKLNDDVTNDDKDLLNLKQWIIKNLKEGEYEYIKNLVNKIVMKYDRTK